MKLKLFGVLFVLSLTVSIYLFAAAIAYIVRHPDVVEQRRQEFVDMLLFR